MEITKFQLDALREICAVGAGHASTALSELSQKSVTVTFPSVKEYPLEQVPSILANDYEHVASVHLQIDSVISGEQSFLGSMLLIFPEKSAKKFTHMIHPEGASENANEELDDFAKDTLKEMGNILSGACLNAISEFLDFTLVESLPDVSVDMLSATMDAIISNLAIDSDEALVFTTDFKVEGEDITAYFLMLFDPSVYKLLLRDVEGE